MNDLQQLQQAKEQCITDLIGALPRYRERLDAADSRLALYIEDALSNHASHSNLYELLGIRKVFRLMDSYQLDPERVQRTLRAIEGVWENGRHQKGGLKFDTPRGDMHVRLMPYQAWMIFCIYAFKVDVNMERPYVKGEPLLPTEWVGEDGNVWDTRRLIQEAHWFLTRKAGKTELGGAVDFTEVCFLGDINGQALICTNSAEQSLIAYEAIRNFAMQVDPSCVNRMGGKFFRMTRRGLNWQPGHRMKGEIKCLSAGKTSKDGLYASVVHADEHGQARYVNGASDMQSTVETAWGSTGPRREKLLLHTTTAGNVSDGPYKRQLEKIEERLLCELDYPLGSEHRTDDDYWTAMLLQLDKWEITDDLEKLNDTELFRKVNRSIGTTVQPTYYRERLHEAAQSEDTKKEVLTKDFNMWQSDRFVKWLSGDQIRQRQVERRITDCKYEDGWNIFVGCDFSQGDDLFAITYLGVNYRNDLPADQRMFADTEAWIVEAALKDSPNRPLYELWIEQGWLKVCPGDVFIPDMPINDMMAKNRDGLNLFMFGYDAAQSIQPINTIKAWLQSLGIDAQTIKKMVVPVPQTFVAQNGILQKIEWLLLGQEYNIDTGGWSYTNDTPFLYLSNSPLWPWCFGNCKVEISSSELRAVRKSGQHSKIDPIHALIDALWLFDLSEGQVQQ